MSKKQKITYFFLEGRSERLSSKGPNDFFYFYNFFNKNNYDISYIEAKSEGVRASNFFLYIIDKLLRKLTKLSVHSHKFLNISNVKTIIESDKLILTNESIGFSLAIFFKIIKKFNNLDTTVFIMGSFDKAQKNKYFSKLYLKFMLKTYDKFIFLGLGELEHAKKVYPYLVSNFFYLPFTIDQDFWSTKHLLLKNSEEKSVLFIGNDLNRDYRFLLELCNHAENIKFKIITNRIDSKKINNSNIALIKGDWKESTLSDLDIKKLYAESTLTIIPLVETYQPSGQSVALQSMSMGVPVLITDTKGFWDREIFKDRDNIIFMKENNVYIWKDTLEKLINDQDTLSKISKNAKQTLIKELDQKLIFGKFQDIINS